MRAVVLMAMIAWASDEVGAQPRGAQPPVPQTPAEEPHYTVRLDVRLPILGGIGTDGLAFGAAGHVTHQSGVRLGGEFLGFTSVDAGTFTYAGMVGYELGSRVHKDWKFTVPLMAGYRYLNRGSEGGNTRVEHAMTIRAGLEFTRWGDNVGFQLRLCLGYSPAAAGNIDEDFVDAGIALGVAFGR